MMYVNTGIYPSESQILDHADQYPSVIPFSVDRIPRDLSQEGLAFSYTPTVPQQHSAPVSVHQHPMNASYSAPVSTPSLVTRSPRTTSFLGCHPYSQPTARRAMRDHTIHRRSLLSQDPMGASFSSPSSVLRFSGPPPSLALHPCPRPITYHSAVEHVPPQHYAFDYPFAPPPLPAQNWVPETQPAFVVPDASQLQPQPHASSIARPTSAPAPEVPSQSMAYSLAEQADIEYASGRYGNKPCFYQCRYDVYGSPCGKYIVGDRRRILRHLRKYHHLQAGTAICQWQGCTRSGQMRQENLSRHIVGHLGVKWGCPHCRVPFSRDDALRRHIERVLPGVEVPEADVMPGCGACSFHELSGY